MTIEHPESGQANDQRSPAALSSVTMRDDPPPTTDPEPPVPRIEPGGRGLVVVLNRDLFFGVRIADVLRTAGYAVAFASTAAAFVERLRAADPPAALGVIDLGAGPDWALLRPLTDDSAFPTPLLAFGPHKDIDAMRAAKAAGVTRLVSNGEFHRNLLGLVERYARITGRG